MLLQYEILFHKYALVCHKLSDYYKILHHSGNLIIYSSICEFSQIWFNHSLQERFSNYYLWSHNYDHYPLTMTTMILHFTIMEIFIISSPHTHWYHSLFDNFGLFSPYPFFFVTFTFLMSLFLFLHFSTASLISLQHRISPSRVYWERGLVEICPFLRHNCDHLCSVFA